MHKKLHHSFQHQHGGIVGIILVALVVVGILSYLGSTAFSVIVGGNQRINLSTQSSQTLTQAAYTLVTEARYNASGIPVALAYASGDINGGGSIPSNSAAPKIDSFGSSIGYCTNNASLQSEPVFAVVSAGRDKTFNTTCAQALLNNFQGDDKVIVKSVANIMQGVGGTVYFGDPVNTVSDLGLLANVKPGQMRTVLSDGSVWTNPTGSVGESSWVKVSIPPSGSAVVTPIVEEGSACNINNDNVTSAEEGIVINVTRTNILTCQNGQWLKSGEPNIMTLTGVGGVSNCPTNWDELYYGTADRTGTNEPIEQRTCRSQRVCTSFHLKSIENFTRGCPNNWIIAHNGIIDKRSDGTPTYEMTCYQCSGE
jgi:type II secretory pathway pseudopilin PulG